MPKLKILSGGEVVKIFLQFGFNMASQRGSHIKLRRVMPDGTKQTLTIPNHAEIDRGTLRAICRQVSRYISETEWHAHFYTENQAKSSIVPSMELFVKKKDKEIRLI